MNVSNITKSINERKYTLACNPDGKAKAWDMFRLVMDKENVPVFGIAACANCHVTMIYKKKDENGKII